MFPGSQHQGRTTIITNIQNQHPTEIATGTVIVTTVIVEVVTMNTEALMEEVMAAMEATRCSPRSQDLTVILHPTSNVRKPVRLCMLRKQRKLTTRNVTTSTKSSAKMVTMKERSVVRCQKYFVRYCSKIFCRASATRSIAMSSR